jgi:hypothetical protein
MTAATGIEKISSEGTRHLHESVLPGVYLPLYSVTLVMLIVTLLILLFRFIAR